MTGFGLKCECGHLELDHVRLMGHPDGADECWGSEECQCGRFRIAQPGLDDEEGA